MGRPKLCGYKQTCKAREGHEGGHDFGEGASSGPSEVEMLRKQVSELTAKLAAGTPDALAARTATAEAELDRMRKLAKDIAGGLKANGMTVIAAQLTELLPKETDEQE